MANVIDLEDYRDGTPLDDIAEAKYIKLPDNLTPEEIGAIIEAIGEALRGRDFHIAP